MKTIIGWIETVYKDNGLWPTIITGFVILALLAAGVYFDMNWITWLE